MVLLYHFKKDKLDGACRMCTKFMVEYPDGRPPLRRIIKKYIK
jgi:hypothetical protein